MKRRKKHVIKMKNKTTSAEFFFYFFTGITGQVRFSLWKVDKRECWGLIKLCLSSSYSGKIENHMNALGWPELIKGEIVDDVWWPQVHHEYLKENHWDRKYLTLVDYY